MGVVDPRFDGAQEQKAVEDAPGWFKLESMSKIKGGRSYTDSPGDAYETRWLEWYVNTTATGSTHLARFYLKTSGASHTSSESSAVRAETYIDPSTGNQLSGQAIHAETKIGTTLGNMVGYATALRGILTIDAVTRAFSGGVYCVAFLTNNVAAGNTVAARHSFIAFEDLGAVKANYLLDSASVASASDGVWETDSGAVGGTVLGYYKVNTAAGAGYLVVYSSHS